MSEAKVSRRGVYKDLSVSPYEFTSPYGDLFKFSSAKKLEIYTRDVPGEIDRVTKFLCRLDLPDHIPEEIIGMLYRHTYRAFYDRIEG